jgi:hypothetical protein
MGQRTAAPSLEAVASVRPSRDSSVTRAPLR